MLRQDPDVVLVGEMRDLETIEAALTIAETGHLVFATLHTNSAVQSINRIIDVFPPHQQSQVRAQLSFVLEGVVSQLLLPRARRAGPRVSRSKCSCRTPPIRNLIREDKVHQIYSQMQVGQGEARHADAEPVAVFALLAPHDLARRGDGPLERSRRAPLDDRGTHGRRTHRPAPAARRARAEAETWRIAPETWGERRDFVFVTHRVLRNSREIVPDIFGRVPNHAT